MGGRTLGATWTVRDVLNWTRTYFKQAGIVQPRLEAEILLAHTLGFDRLHLYLAPDRPLTPEERARFREVVKKRRQGTPLQYLTGEVQFLGLRFRVRPGALIPRPETEELVMRALRLVSRDRAVSCLDLGTGTGVIGICLAKYLPHATVTAVDVVPEALALAQENADLNGVSDQITFLPSDWFAQVTGKFDLIAANPPYIAEESLAELPTEVRDHEPQTALDGGESGVREINRIAAELHDHLMPGGMVVLEIGDGQGDSVTEIIERAGLTDVRVERDLAGKERFVIAQCP